MLHQPSELFALAVTPLVLGQRPLPGTSTQSAAEHAGL